MTPAETELINTGVNVLRALLSLAASLGVRDAMLEAFDGVLSVARSKTDRDLAEKHRKTDPAPDGTSGAPGEP